LNLQLRSELAVSGVVETAGGVVETAAVQRSRVFYPQLESLRGLAAFVVLLHHALGGAISIDDPANPHSIRVLGIIWTFLFNGGSAVILFFVLSGFVMGLNVDLNDGLTLKLYAKFLLRRIFRLYPVVFVSIVLALAGHHYWVRQNFSLEETINFFLLRSVSANPPLWSIQVEAIVSAIYPLLLFVVVRGGNAARALILPVCIAFYFLGYGPQIVLGYVPAFILGLLIPYVGQDLMADLGRKWSLILLPVAFCVYSSTGLIGLFQLLPPSPGLLMQTIGAFYIVAFFTFWCDKVVWLETGFVRWLGRVSFSLYAVHVPVILWIAPFVAGPPSWKRVLLTVGLSVPASLLVAAIVARLVEWPFQRLGRKIASI
jgi:peptidoglycan/LPS O-acetylase OafA/YrhL